MPSRDQAAFRSPCGLAQSLSSLWTSLSSRLASRYFFTGLGRLKTPMKAAPAAAAQEIITPRGVCRCHQKNVSSSGALFCSPAMTRQTRIRKLAIIQIRMVSFLSPRFRNPVLAQSSAGGEIAYAIVTPSSKYTSCAL
jgi:hypothetical protein